MPRTYEPLASQTLGSDTASVEFTSISGSYTDLILVVHGSGTTAADAILELNGDTASNYSVTGIRGTGSAASSARYSAAYLNGAATWTTGAAYTFIVHLMSYSNTNVFKTWLSSAAKPDGEVNRVVGLYRSTSAVTSIKIKRGGGNIASGATFALYGIKAA